MAAISKAWVTIADTAVDPDSPIDATLMTGLRDIGIHLREWLGASFTAGAIQDHDHDGVNSKLVLIGPNYVRNPGFESDLGGWTVTTYSGGTVVRTTGAGNFNQGVAALSIVSTVLANGGGDVLLEEFKPVNGGHSYPVRVDVKASAANVSSKAEITWYDSAQASISTSTIYSSTNTETAFTTKAGAPLAPSTARFAKIRLTGGVPSSGSATGTIYFDNVFFADADTISIGSVAWAANNVPAGTTSTSLTKVKEIVCPFDGVTSTQFDLVTDSGGNTATGRIYVNGVATGTTRTNSSTTPASFTEDIAVKRGDLVQLYVSGSGGATGSVSNFRLLAAAPMLAPNIQ